MGSFEQIYSLSGKRVWVAGHRGMVDSALVRRLARENCELLVAGRDEVDLKRQDQVEAWMAKARPQAVFLAAARGDFAPANKCCGRGHRLSLSIVEPPCRTVERRGAIGATVSEGPEELAPWAR